MPCHASDHAPDTVVEGREGGFGSLTHGDDDLLERHVGDIAGRIDTGNRSAAEGIHLYLES